jgi:PAT family beta-lactamase induction signal transducer AmpG
VLTGAAAGALIVRFGYVQFYLFTTLAAVPGIVLFWLMMRARLIDASVGSAAKVRAETAPPD